MARQSNWERDHLKIFISHISRNRVKAHELGQELKKYQISCFIAHEAIEPTRKWMEEIEAALLNCDMGIALLYKGFHKSDWTDQEIGFIFGRKKLVIGIINGETPYGFLGKYQGINSKGKTIEQLSRDLFTIILRHDKTKKIMSYNLLTRLEKTGNFDTGRENIRLFERIQYWDKTIEKRLLSTMSKNSQIRENFDISKLEVLIKKWSKK
jgi:TIR domain